MSEKSAPHTPRKIWAVESKRANAVILFFVMLLFLAGLTVVYHYFAALMVTHDDSLRAVKHIYWDIYNDVLIPYSTNPMLYIGIPLLLIIQAQAPAIKSQKVFNSGLLADSIWVFIHAVMVSSFVIVVIMALDNAVKDWTAVFKFGVFAHVPLWLEIVIGYMAIELLGWFNHMLRHKVRVLWVFHEVHHSQSQMNPLSLYRVHPMDYLIAEVIMFLPAIFFEETLGIVLSYLVFSRLHDALSYSNIKTNLGPLRYIFVTPQSHRVHHSSEPEFFDMNYGVTLCIWDRLFGTHSPDDFVYPKTGIPDPEFPEEKGKPWYKAPVTVVQQLYYPFVKAMRLYWR